MASLGTLVPASPLNANDATRHTFTAGVTSDTASFTLGNTPAGLLSMDTLSWQVDYAAPSYSNDTFGLNIRIVNGATILAAADAGGTFANVATAFTNTADVLSSVTGFAYVNTGASKATWDGASVELNATISKSKGWDGPATVDYVAITGTYTADTSQTVSPGGIATAEAFPTPAIEIIRYLSGYSPINSLYPPTRKHMYHYSDTVQYLVIFDDAETPASLVVFKASVASPANSDWTVVVSKTYTESTPVFAVCRNGNKLGIVSGGYTTQLLEFNEFDMSTDAWTIEDEEVASQASQATWNANQVPLCDIIYYGGEYVVSYAYKQSTFHVLRFLNRTGTDTWVDSYGSVIDSGSSMIPQSLLVDDGTKLNIIYQAAGGAATIFHRRWDGTAGGASVSAEETIVNDRSGLNTPFGDVAFHDGMIYISYHQTVSGDNRVVRWTPDDLPVVEDIGAYDNNSTLNEEGATTLIASPGGVYVAYVDLTPSAADVLTLKRYNGTSWYLIDSTTLVADVDPMTTASLNVTEDKVEIAYVDALGDYYKTSTLVAKPSAGNQTLIPGSSHDGVQVGEPEAVLGSVGIVSGGNDDYNFYGESGFSTAADTRYLFTYSHYAPKRYKLWKSTVAAPTDADWIEKAPVPESADFTLLTIDGYMGLTFRPMADASTRFSITWRDQLDGLFRLFNYTTDTYEIAQQIVFSEWDTKDPFGVDFTTLYDMRSVPKADGDVVFFGMVDHGGTKKLWCRYWREGVGLVEVGSLLTDATNYYNIAVPQQDKSNGDILFAGSLEGGSGCTLYRLLDNYSTTLTNEGALTDDATRTLFLYYSCSAYMDTADNDRFWFQGTRTSGPNTGDSVIGFRTDAMPPTEIESYQFTPGTTSKPYAIRKDSGGLIEAVFDKTISISYTLSVQAGDFSPDITYNADQLEDIITGDAIWDGAALIQEYNSDLWFTRSYDGTTAELYYQAKGNDFIRLPTLGLDLVAHGTPEVTADTPGGVNPTGIPSAEAFGSAQVTVAQSVAATGIASQEAFGSFTVVADAIVSPAGIASQEAVGNHVLNTTVTVTATGIASEEAHGSHEAVPGEVTVNAGTIPSGEAFGSVVISTVVTVDVSGIASEESFGSHSIDTLATVSATGIATAEAHGSHNIDTLATVGATGIATAEAFGNPAIDSIVTVSPTGIASEEAFGDSSIDLTIMVSGIASSESFGAIDIDWDQVVAATGIDSLEAFGSATLNVTGGTQNLTASGIGSSEAFGGPQLDLALVASGIATQEAFGSVVVDTLTTVQPTGISSAEEFGGLSIQATYDVLPSGIASAEVVPVPVLSAQVTVSATGIASEEAFGSSSISTVVNVLVTGIASEEAFGLPALQLGAVSLSPSGIGSEEAFGTAQIDYRAYVSGIASAESFGALDVQYDQSIDLTGIPSEETVGSHIVSSGAVILGAVGIASGEVFGSPQLDLTLHIGGIATEESFGTVALSTLYTVSPLSIGSAESFGNPDIAAGNQVAPTGIASEESFGSITVVNRQIVTPEGIASAEISGTPDIQSVVTVEPTGIASGEAFGSVAIEVIVVASPIASNEEFGTPDIQPGEATVSPTGIDSSEAFGTAAFTFEGDILAVGIESMEAFGVPELLGRIGSVSYLKKSSLSVMKIDTELVVGRVVERMIIDLKEAS